MTPLQIAGGEELEMDLGAIAMLNVSGIAGDLLLRRGVRRRKESILSVLANRAVNRGELENGTSGSDGIGGRGGRARARTREGHS